MTQHYPVVFETEADGAISVYVSGLPLYAQANTEAEAEKAIVAMLGHWFMEHPDQAPAPKFKVARVETRSRISPAAHKTRLHRAAVSLVNPMPGTVTSAKKRKSSRANGRLGGRPRLAKR